MKKILITVMMAILLPAVAFGQQTGSQEQVNWLDAPTPDGSPTLRETSDWLAKTLTLYGGSHGSNDLVSESNWGKQTRSVDGASMIVDARIDGQCHFVYKEIDADGTIKGNHQNVSYTGVTVSVPLGIPGLFIENNGDNGYPIRIQTGSTQDIAVTSAALNARDFRINDYSRIQVLREAAWSAGTTSYTNVVQPAVEVNPPNSNEAGSQIRVSASEMRPRIISALQHAAALCGSTYQAPAQKNEPF